jgi:hypothetical protein
MRPPWVTSVTLLVGLTAGLSCTRLHAAALNRSTTLAVAQAEAPAPNGGAVNVTSRRTQDLYAACLAEQGSASGWCSAYLMGIADTLAAFGDGGNGGGVCKANYTIDQLPEIFLTWARAHDAMLQLDMLAGVTLAFRQRWPCQ